MLVFLKNRFRIYPMEILGKILGGVGRVKMMRLFLLNKNKIFTPKDISLRTRVGIDGVRKEIRVLSSADFIKKKGNGYIFNSLFAYTKEFEGLLVTAETLSKEDVLTLFKRNGRLKFMLVSGIFIKNKDSRLDMLLVGDAMKKSKIEEAMRKLEAEIGVELSYAVFTTKEFLYRLNMYDKLVRDVIDFPHEVLFHSKDLSPLLFKKQS